MKNAVMETVFRACLCFLLSTVPITTLAAAVVALTDGEDQSFDTTNSVVSGRAALSFGRGGVYNFSAGSFAYTASAFASSAAGTSGSAIIATSVGGPPSVALSVQTLSILSDDLTFSGSGDVLFRLVVQGGFALQRSDSGSGFVDALAVLSADGESSSARATLDTSAGGLRIGSVGDVTVVSDLPANYIVSLADTVFVRAGVPIAVVSTLSVSLRTPGTGGASGLFDQTARLEIIVPRGLTFTSASGDFLSAAEVPVPGSFVLMLTGLAAFGSIARRRKHTSRCASHGCTYPLA